MNVIKVGFCVSYDWELLRHSLPRVYKQADIICLAIDKDRHTWSCNPYQFDNGSFIKFLSDIDVDNKIDLYEDDFSLSTLDARGNCNRHRQLIADRMGKGGWHIQIDCDEYFLDFSSFVEDLLALKPWPSGNEKPLNVHPNLITLFKKVDEGYLLIDSGDDFETAPFATNVPKYERARHNGHFNVYTDCFVLHESWARTEEDLRFKIANWGHSAEELDSKKRQESYINLWKALDRYNYSYLYNFHPAKPEVWAKLRFMPGDSVAELIEGNDWPEYPHSKLWLLLRNNRNVARLRHVLKKIAGHD
jgi:hypothetical protein